MAEESDFFGSALAAGDFNNDTLADLAIGAPFEDVGSVLDAGAINVLYGSAARLTATGNQQFFQGSGGVIGVAEDGDTFGFALAGGDFNNNGFDDLAIGAISEDIGAIQDAGAVNVLYGSAARLTTTGNQQFFQGSGGLVGTAEEGDFVGAALSTGDYDNDTFADLAIGAPFEDIGTHPGRRRHQHPLRLGQHAHHHRRPAVLPRQRRRRRHPRGRRRLRQQPRMSRRWRPMERLGQWFSFRQVPNRRSRRSATLVVGSLAHEPNAGSCC